MKSKTSFLRLENLIRDETKSLPAARALMLPKERKLPLKNPSLRNTAFAGLAILVGFLLLLSISAPFEYDADQTRPVLMVVTLLVVTAVLAFAGLGFALQVSQSQHKNVLKIVLLLAVSIRLVAIFTPPILEIDYYRYIWDGKVVCEGVSPYRFSPTQVLEPGISQIQGLNHLAELATRSQSNRDALSRIHYANYTTVYPPVSQVVFAATMNLIPESASVESHVIAIKIAMTLFDLGTILLLGWLLNMACVHPGWLIAYAWNPLVIKEIANSGHLDSIATFLAVLTVCLVVRQRLFPNVKYSSAMLGFAGVALGLGVGAKLYPVVLFPALLVAIVGSNAHRRGNQLGKRLFAGAIFLSAFILASCLVLLPLFHNQLGFAADHPATEAPTPLAASALELTQRQDGFGGFFSTWRMNDPVFSTIYFNLKCHTQDSRPPWYVVTTQRWRSHLDTQFRAFGFDGRNSAYSMARIVTLGLFSIFYLWQLLKLYNNKHDDERWVIDLACRITLILALFLFLQPTVNPWYFVWVAPLTCLTNNKGWLLASGILMLYYCRFWFKSLTEEFTFAGYSFDGVKFYDHHFVFVEFGLIIAVLIYFTNRKKHPEPEDSVRAT